MSLEHEHILNPITALVLYQKPDGPLLILAGEGSFLKIFQAEDSKLLGQCEIFNGQAIHGIIATEASHNEDAQILIWGGSSVTLLNQYDFDELLVQGRHNLVDTAFEASDWILDTAISPLDPNCCFLITAHNTVLRARFNKTSSQVIFETVASPSRSILYSAHLVVEPSGEILVAAGTVFGEIIVWSCSTSGDAKVLFTFTGHEGSIFGVNISPPLILADKRQSRLLASCSDDRTIRVWDLTTKSTANATDKKLVLLRETGFTQNGAEQNQEEIRCLATVMAHASRIWHVKFLIDHKSTPRSSVNLLSFGEDSTTQQWSLDIRSCAESKSERKHVPEAPRLTHVGTAAFHSGKHIWSTALRFIHSSKAILATGGADGKISLRSVVIPSESSLSSFIHKGEVGISTGAAIPLDAMSQSTSWDLEEDILQYLPLLQVVVDEDIQDDVKLQSTDIEPPQGELMDDKPPQKKKKAKKVVKDAFNRYCFASETQLLLTTTFGRILLGEVGGTINWKEVALPQSASQDLKSYSVVLGIPELGLAYLAGANGKIYALASGYPMREVGDIGYKVAEMFKITNPRTKNFELLVTTLATGEATLFSIESTGLIHLSAKYTLPHKFVLTSVGRANNLLIFGSRSGSLTIIDREDRANAHETKSTDAITAIIPLSSGTNEADNSTYFLATGRDGVYSVFSAAISHDPSTDVIDNIRCVHVGSLPFGPMVESAWFDGSDLLLYGFKGKNFVVWNETRQLEVINVECGGAHRSYAYSPLQSLLGGYFTYTKASKLYIHSQQAPSHTIVKRGGHGREIKACAVSPDGEFIATGAEDTTIRIWSYDDKGSSLESQFRCHAIMQNHSAGIQHLHWHGSKYLFSSGGVEEFFIWSIERIPGFGIGVICEATCPDESEDRDLRIMSLDVSDTIGNSMLISLAYSDSTIRIYMYSKKDGFSLLTKGIYTSSCLTQIRHLHVSHEEAYILTAATDGYLTLWKVDLSHLDVGLEPSNSQLHFLGTQKVHQSTIKALDFVKTKNSFLVATGGDDNALGISIYSFNKLTSKPTSYVLRSAHAAAITGLCILSTSEENSESDTMTIVSSSNDQRVKEWQVQLSTVSENGLSVVNIQNPSDGFTSIADVGDVAFLKTSEHEDRRREQKILIVGNGMEVWKLDGCSR